ncbi:MULTISPECIES: hypothetical protein [unclassified Kribbella]|uniref:hypothetical protein n=1 Tax=unclassified Kribbella TaxID=2644121 RepID=UPI0030164A84
MREDAHNPLPLTWLVILSVAGAAGFGMGLMAGPIGGVGTALGVVGLLNKIVD